MQRKTIGTFIGEDGRPYEKPFPSLAAGIRHIAGRGRGDGVYETLYKDVARRVHRGEDRIFRFA